MDEEKKDLYEELDAQIQAALNALTGLTPGSVAYNSQTEAISRLMASKEAHISEQNKLAIAQMESSDNKEKLKEESGKWRWGEFWRGMFGVLTLGLSSAVNRANVMDIIASEGGGTIIRSSAFKIFDRVGPPKI